VSASAGSRRGNTSADRGTNTYQPAADDRGHDRCRSCCGTRTSWARGCDQNHWQPSGNSGTEHLELPRSCRRRLHGMVVRPAEHSICAL